MYQKILLAYDGSPDGREALAQAAELASTCGAAVHLVAIIDRSEQVVVALEGVSLISEEEQVATQTALDAGVRFLKAAGCIATNAVKYGNPAHQIVLSAREIGADLIVVGHRDQGTLARWLSGSVGASILHHAPCSVLVAVKSGRRKSNVVPIRRSRAPREHERFS
jgi:nucleotide-binding universal stress UspA family protein